MKKEEERSSEVFVSL